MGEYEDWIDEMCIPTIMADEEPQGENPNMPPVPPPDHIPIFSEKPIKPLTGGPPRRGKPKPPAEPVVVGGEAAEAIHRAISMKR